MGADQTRIDAQADSGPGLRTVVTASAAGTAFEWYDFFIFASLTAVIANKFYANVGEATAYILTLLLFGVGFVVRRVAAIGGGSNPHSASAGQCC